MKNKENIIDSLYIVLAFVIGLIIGAGLVMTNNIDEKSALEKEKLQLEINKLKQENIK